MFYIRGQTSKEMLDEIIDYYQSGHFFKGIVLCARQFVATSEESPFPFRGTIAPGPDGLYHPYEPHQPLGRPSPGHFAIPILDGRNNRPDFHRFAGLDILGIAPGRNHGWLVT